MDIQQLITLSIVAVAAITLGRRLRKSAMGEGCDGCAGACGKPTPKHGVRPVPQAIPLVTLSMSRGKGRPTNG
ncbi:MAG: hypothetical protein H8F28_16675 [Fibrella sp.]|nr:hypothetical protein [Armatimonadota bacterium]